MKKRLVSLLFLMMSINCSSSFGKDVALAQGKDGNQILCPFGYAYDKDTDSCLSVFKEKPKAEKKNDVIKTVPNIHVLLMITIKEGDTCMKVTKYSLQECIKLGRKYGRIPSVFIAQDGGRTFDVPLYAGEQIAFVRITKNETSEDTYILSEKK
jgi:hypothetical protein